MDSHRNDILLVEQMGTTRVWIVILDVPISLAALCQALYKGVSLDIENYCTASLFLNRLACRVTVNNSWLASGFPFYPRQKAQWRGFLFFQ